MDEEIPYNELLLDVEDGIVVGLYHYLWLKDGKGRACPEVNVPHTIIISNGRPKVWYFTSGKEHCIKRKNRANITNATITEALAPRPKPTINTNAYSDGFTGYKAAVSNSADPKPALHGAWGNNNYSATQQPQQSNHHQQQSPSLGASRRNKPTDAGGGAAGGRAMDGTSMGTNLGPWPHHGVVARFQGSMTMPHNGGGSPTRGASLGRKKKGAQFELQDESVEFFTREQLAEILPPGHTVVHGVAALHEGVLQRFVQPRGQHHFSIRATWSPNACVVERRTSKAKLNDPRVALAERLSAWDGPTWLSDHTLINGTVLHGSVCRLCDNVASHLAEVSGGAVRVLRMVLFFCVDDANRIWLTHCGTLKTERLREHMMAAGRFGGGPHLLNGPSRFLRPGHATALVPSSASALRLRSPDGSRAMSGGGASGGALSKEGSLELPAPSAAFVASKGAAADSGSASGNASPRGARFLCVLTGEMYPGTQRCDVTYKQLLQHWFGLASQLPNEGDRLRAMDTIPLAIRRANPSLTREWYLRVRSQPTFLYRTAPVCLEAAAQITGMALDELQRTLMPSPSTMGSVAAAAAAAVGAAGNGIAGPLGAGSGGGGGGGVSNPGNGLLAGWAASGATGAQTHVSPPTTARGPVPESFSRQANSSTARVQLAGGPSLRQRPATALPPAGPSVHLMQQHQQQMTSFRSGARPTQQQQQQVHTQPGGVSTRRLPMTRSKSASPSVAASRLAHPSTASVGGSGAAGAAAGLPSMLLPREKSPGTGLGPQPSFLQAYGPTPEQAAEAAAIAAALPYEVLDEARQLAETEDAVGRERDTAATSSPPRSPHRRHGASDKEDDRDGAVDGSVGDGHKGNTEGSAGDRSRNMSLGESASARQPVGGPSTSSSMAHVGGGVGGASNRNGSAPNSPGLGGALELSYAAAAATAVHGNANAGSYTVPRPSRLPGRVSTSSEITEMGSAASFSDPSSPNGPHPMYHQLHTHPHAPSYSNSYLHAPMMTGGGGTGGGGAAAVGQTASIAASRMSPPRSTAAPTLHTIHEEGTVAVPPPLSSARRACSPLGAAESIFPPPSRNCAPGSHSVPRMRPPTRGGLDRSVGPVAVGGMRRHPGPPQMYGGGGSAAASNGGASSGLQRRNSFSESGDVPALPGSAAAAAAASLNSTMASSIGSLSRRSTSNQAVLSSEDMRTLRELSEAYSAAERLTQQLLAQAHDILSEDGSSRPGSTGNSPMHGGRRPAPSPRGFTPSSRPGTGNSGGTTGGGGTRPASLSGSGTGLARVSSGSGRQANGLQRRSSSSAPSPVLGSTPSTGSALGPSPLGQREANINPTGSGKALGVGGGGGGSGSEDGEANSEKGLSAATAEGALVALSLPPVIPSRSSSKGSSIVSPPGAMQAAEGVEAGSGTAADGSGGGVGEGTLAAGGLQLQPPGPRNLDLFTSAEADLLAEALQD